MEDKLTEDSVREMVETLLEETEEEITCCCIIVGIEGGHNFISCGTARDVIGVLELSKTKVVLKNV